MLACFVSWLCRHFSDRFHLDKSLLMPAADVPSHQLPKNKEALDRKFLPSWWSVVYALCCIVYQGGLRGGNLQTNRRLPLSGKQRRKTEISGVEIFHISFLYFYRGWSWQILSWVHFCHQPQAGWHLIELISNYHSYAAIYSQKFSTKHRFIVILNWRTQFTSQ